MNDMYTKLNDAVSCSDLLEYGEKVIAFSDFALESCRNSNQRKRILDLFYSRLAIMASGDMFNQNDDAYSISEDINAVRKYMLFSRPAYTTPLKTLKSFQEYGREISETIVPPQGKVISVQRIHSIMEYLDNEYNFSKKVFNVRKPVFAILDYSKTDYNSESALFQTPEGMIAHFFLFHMKKDAEPRVTPEAVFFHELCHALHFKYTNGKINISDEIMIDLIRYGFAAIVDCSPEEQAEILADVLSVAMMKGSIFEKYNPFPQIHDDDVNGFKQILLKLLKSFEE